MSGILVQTVGQCKMQIWRYPENFNQTTDVFRFHLSKMGSAFAQLLSRSSIMRVGTSSTNFIEIFIMLSLLPTASVLVDHSVQKNFKGMQKWLK
jgi:hypothetical protein